MLKYCNIEGIGYDTVGDDWEHYIFYKGWSIPCEAVEKPMFELYKKHFPYTAENMGYNSKPFFKFIEFNKEKVFEILEDIINTPFS